MIKEVNQDQIKMKTERENETREESKIGLNISSQTIKTIMFTHTKLIAPPGYTSSFSFSLLDNSKYLTSWVKKCRDENQTPSKRIFSKTSCHPQIFFSNMACI